jgi:hypothetical protein
MQATRSGSGPSLDYGSDYGRLSRSEDLSQPTHRTAKAGFEPFGGLHSEQQIVNTNASATSAAQLQDTTIQEQPGYGHFNQARFLALRAPPAATASPDESHGRSSLSEGPLAPVYEVTAVNAEPVAPRGKHRIEPSGGFDLTAQAAEELLNEVGMVPMGHIGQKRRASDDCGSGAFMVKRRAMSDLASSPSSGLDVAKLSDALKQSAFQPPPFAAASHHYTSLATQHKSMVGNVLPSCTRCFKDNLKCDGTAHCGQCQSSRCYYVLCASKTCRGEGCKKIHRFQYDLAARKSGEARRNVLGDNVHLSGLGVNKGVKDSLKRVIALMGKGRGRPLLTDSAPDSTRKSARVPAVGRPSMHPMVGPPPIQMQTPMPIAREAPSAMVPAPPTQGLMVPWSRKLSNDMQPSSAEPS